MQVAIKEAVFNTAPTIQMKSSLLSVELVQYNLGGHSATVYWSFLDPDGNRLQGGNLVMGAAVVDAWGTDDTVLVNAVLQQLGLTAA